MLRDYLWQPLVSIGLDEVAYLMHPGSGMTPVRLEPGWQWHWPLLNTIRVVSHGRFGYVFGQAEAAREVPVATTEAVVCVSRDHQLFVVEGWLEIGDAFDHSKRATEPDYPKYISYSPTKLNRHIQSLARQSLREAVAGFSTKQLHSQLFSQLQSKSLSDLNYKLRPLDLEARQLMIGQIRPYRRRPADAKD